MKANELKQKQYYRFIRALLVVTALALLVYVAFSMIYSSKRFQQRTSLIEWVSE